MIALASNPPKNKIWKCWSWFGNLSRPDPIRFLQNLLNPAGLESRNPGPAHLWYVAEVFGLWFFWVRVQSCFANFESKSNPDPVPTKFNQSDSCLSPGNYKSSKQPVTFFQKNAIQIQSESGYWKENFPPDRVGSNGGPFPKSPISNPCTSLLQDGMLYSA